jgi:hypothetical protein
MRIADNIQAKSIDTRASSLESAPHRISILLTITVRLAASRKYK